MMEFLTLNHFISSEDLTKRVIHQIQSMYVYYMYNSEPMGVQEVKVSQPVKIKPDLSSRNPKGESQAISKNIKKSQDKQSILKSLFRKS